MNRSVLAAGFFLFNLASFSQESEVKVNHEGKDFRMHISADNGYRLYVNGKYITYGPAAGDIYHYRYESIDITGHLKAGTGPIIGSPLPAIPWAHTVQAVRAKKLTLRTIPGTGRSRISRAKDQQREGSPDINHLFRGPLPALVIRRTQNRRTI